MIKNFLTLASFPFQLPCRDEWRGSEEVHSPCPRLADVNNEEVLKGYDGDGDDADDEQQQQQAPH